MENIRGNTLIINGILADASGYSPDSSADVYYEVIRVIKGKYLFLEEHLLRLRSSCRKSILNCPDSSSIISQLKQLIEYSEISEGNVKLLFYSVLNKTNIACFFTPHFYPSVGDYSSGVKVKSFQFERPDPNIKKWNESFRRKVNRFIRDEHIYEAILISEKGTLTEGSRSNLFFIDEKDRVITAPLEKVLPGITRNYVFEICRELGVPVIEKTVYLDGVTSMKACFITGTSPKVLPVQKLNKIPFNAQHETILRISQAFSQHIEKSLNKNV